MLPHGKVPRKLELGPIEPLTRNDLAALAGPREASVAEPKTLRDSHHRLARMFASGMRVKEIAELTGYGYNRLSILRRSPAMQELIARYRSEVDEAWRQAQVGYMDLITNNMLAAERHIADHIDGLDAEGELLPIRTALAISRDAADRLGYHKKSTNFNVNADFASMLEAAIKRSGKGNEPKLVEASTTVDPSPRQLQKGPSLAPLEGEAKPMAIAGRIARRI